MNLASMFGLPPRRRPAAKPPAASNASVARVVETARLRARVADLEARQARRERDFLLAQARIRERCTEIATLPQHRQGAALAAAFQAGLGDDVRAVMRHRTNRGGAA